MQILHYEHGQKYEPHYDFFHDKANLELGGHRVATVLMYLSEVAKGGETVFPNSEVSYTFRICCFYVFSSYRHLMFIFAPFFISTVYADER